MTTLAVPTTDISFEELCERGRLAQESMDKARWIIGDDALLIVKRYGQDNLADYARNINVRKASVYAYRQVCEFYPYSTRVEFLADNPTITYTHMRSAMKLGNAEQAYAALEHAAGMTLTTDGFDHYLKHELGIGRQAQAASGVLLEVSAKGIKWNRAAAELTFVVDDVASADAFVEYWRQQREVILVQVNEMPK